MNIQEMRKHEWIVSWSGGKDSTATIIKMLEYNVPIKKIIYVRMMYTETIPATLPIMTNFVDKVAEQFKSMGLDVEIVKTKPLINLAKNTYKRSKKAEANGKTYGMGAFGRASCKATGEKIKAVKEISKQYENEYEMIGYACDEDTRIHRLGGKKQSILVELGITEKECFGICAMEGLLSPLYELEIKRDGCWFCPNAGRFERFYIKNNYPELYALIKEQYKLTHFDMSNRNNWYKEIHDIETNNQLNLFGE